MNNTKHNSTNRNTILKDLNLKIWNRWTQWSLCSKCDEMGKKTKFGHCLVSYNKSILTFIYRHLM